jgi:hypothetical protein
MLDLGARAVKQMVSYDGAPGSPAEMSVFSIRHSRSLATSQYRRREHA